MRRRVLFTLLVCLVMVPGIAAISMVETAAGGTSDVVLGSVALFLFGGLGSRVERVR